jgi:tRNA U55 pseudouridine synthase TruB
VTNAKRRAPADPIDGVLALDKPLGVSSTTALQQARRLLQARKAGHTGTLDPLASGLLPLTSARRRNSPRTCSRRTRITRRSWRWVR